jgi:hypothetical protein
MLLPGLDRTVTLRPMLEDLLFGPLMAVEGNIEPPTKHIRNHGHHGSKKLERY